MQTPRSLIREITTPALRQSVHRLFGQSPALRVGRELMGPEGLWKWAITVGPCVNAELAAMVPPIPPEEFRRINAAVEPETFLWRGLVDAERFIDKYLAYRSGRHPPPARLLDFGCGCGRLARFLAAQPERWDLHGCDVNSDLVGWCAHNLAGMTAFTNSRLPPLPNPDASFDLVYSFSVFTHMPEDASVLWIRELGRVLSPGGVLVITTIGPAAIDTLAGSEEVRANFGFTEDELVPLRHALDSSGFVIRPYPSIAPSMGDVGDGYGLVFVSPERVKGWAAGLFDVVEHEEGTVNHWQDVVVMVRR